MSAEIRWLPVPHGELRAQFPSLHRQVNGRPAVFLDGPGGTQTPAAVMEAMTAYLSRDNSNLGGRFVTSEQTVQAVAAARRETAHFLNAERAEEIVFGQNMTSLTFALSHALRRTWRAGDEVVITSLDHDANVAPWIAAATDAGAAVRTWEFRREDGTLRLEELERMIHPRTKLVAFTHASNALGTIPDVAGAVKLIRGKAPEALVFIDAVHYTPHQPVDVRAIDCDFLSCSAYKFCGPHLGVLYGKYEHLDRLEAYKVRASSDLPPGKWETGTQSFESIAGLRACLAYLTQFGGGKEPDVRGAMSRIRAYEADLSREFLTQSETVPGLKIYGLTSLDRVNDRTPTFAITLKGWNARDVAARLGEQGIFVWDGHFYALGVVERLGLAQAGGLVRIGFAHYNTPEEVQLVIEALRALERR